MKSAVFLVTLHSPAGHEEGDGEEGEHLMPNVLDGVSLFLANNIKRGQEAGHQYHHNGQQGRNHEELVVLGFVVEKER